MMLPSTVLLIGGAGFIGSHVAHLLAAHNVRVIVPTRRRDRAKHLILLPTVEVIEADVNDPAVLRRLTEGADAVVYVLEVYPRASRTVPFVSKASGLQRA